MRIVAWDLETSNLNANFGRILCCSFAPIPRGKVYTFSCENFKDKPGNDANLSAAIRDELEKYDIWVTYNGKMYDQGFLNTRLILNRGRTLTKKLHIDVYYYCRKPFLKIHSARLEAVQDTLGLKNKKTKLDPDTWTAAMHGDSESLARVIRHCEQDVKVLRELLPVITPFIKNIHV